MDGLTKSPHMHTAEGRMDRSSGEEFAGGGAVAAAAALGPSVERKVASFGRFERL